MHIHWFVWKFLLIGQCIYSMSRRYIIQRPKKKGVSYSKTPGKGLILWDESTYVLYNIMSPLMHEIIPTHLPQPVSIPGSSLTPSNHYDL